MRLRGVGIECVGVCVRVVWCLFVGVVVGFACATRSILNSKYVNILYSLIHLASNDREALVLLYVYRMIEIHIPFGYIIYKTNPPTPITCC